MQCWCLSSLRPMSRQNWSRQSKTTSRQPKFIISSEGYSQGCEWCHTVMCSAIYYGIHTWLIYSENCAVSEWRRRCYSLRHRSTVSPPLHQPLASTWKYTYSTCTTNGCNLHLLYSLSGQSILTNKGSGVTSHITISVLYLAQQQTP